MAFCASPNGWCTQADPATARSWPATPEYSYSVTGAADYTLIQLPAPGLWRTHFGYSSLTELADGRLGLLFETGSPDCHTDPRGGGCSSACQVRFLAVPAF